MIQIHDKQYFIGWIDSNNMKNGLREHIIKDFLTKGHYIVRYLYL